MPVVPEEQTYIETSGVIPDLLALHESNSKRYPFLLESSARHELTGRFDLLFAFPGESLVATPTADEDHPPFLQTLKSWWSRERGQHAPRDDWPFWGGWFLFLSYELAGEIEPSLHLPAPRTPMLLTAKAVRCPAAVIVDHVRAQSAIVAESQEMLDQIRTDLTKLTPEPGSPFPTCRLTEEPAEKYLDRIRRAKHYIREGDIFQANLSRSWHACYSRPISAAALYRRLKHSNPAPFSGLAMLDDRAVISTSPERLVSVRGGRVDTRPIAGTRPRSADRDQDEALLTELITHPKERAEHVMLIDLERNDLGRICKPGSVQVSEMMTVESYAHVHHIVSNVIGTLQDDMTPVDVIQATFPGGTITGCPKVRCMEIIAELEGEGRGLYTGSMGYLSRDGQMDLNILIRSALLSEDQVFFRTGGGIVADSDPEHELRETRAKARGLLAGLNRQTNR